MRRPGRGAGDAEEREAEMKPYLAVVVAAVVVAVAVPAKAQEPPKLAVAVIDVNLLVQDSAAGKEAMVRLKKAQDEKVAEHKKLADELAGLQKQLDSQRSTLTDSKIADLQKQIEDKSIALKRFDDDAQQQLEDAKRKELDGLEKQIMPIIQELGKERKLLLIFNKFQSGLVYADDSVDLTDEVLKRFNTRVTK
jgi:outer membrane protein